MRISIITPTFKRTTYLDQTIESIVTQKGNFELEYIIQDGGSGPDLIDILDKWKTKIENNDIEIGCNQLEFKYFVEKDNGMYDAINRGFSKSTGEIIAWLNSDDMYHPYALQTVMHIFEKHDSIFWLTGIPNSFNSEGARTGFDGFPPSYSKEYLSQGFYDVKFIEYGFNWLQQESTFWRRTLWNKIGGSIDCTYKYAADFHLWREFAKHADLVRVQSFLGGFRVHDDQITANPQLYRDELPDVGLPPKNLKRLRKLLSAVPVTRKLFFNKFKGYPFMNILKLKFNHITGRTVEWSFTENTWVVRLKSII